MNALCCFDWLQSHVPAKAARDGSNAPPFQYASLRGLRAPSFHIDSRWRWNWGWELELRAGAGTELELELGLEPGAGPRSGYGPGAASDMAEPFESTLGCLPVARALKDHWRTLYI